MRWQLSDYPLYFLRANLHHPELKFESKRQATMVDWMPTESPAFMVSIAIKGNPFITLNLMVIS
jgi:hypothetical protein